MDILNIEEWRNILVDALSTLWSKLAGFAPNLVGAIFVLIIGYFIAKLIAKIVQSLLIKVHFDVAFERIGASSAFATVGLPSSGSKLVGTLTFWFILLIFLISVAETLGLDEVAQTIETFVLYLPSVIGAVLVFVVGALIAAILRDMIRSGADRLGVEYANPLANVSYGILIVIVSILSIEQLKFDTTILVHVLEILLIAAGAALALTLGLGSKRISAELISGVYARELFQPGGSVSFKDVQGTIEQVGSVSTIIKTASGEKLVVPNHQLLESIVTREN
jgi:small-conductance mechanosensitive channel